MQKNIMAIVCRDSSFFQQESNDIIINEMKTVTVSFNYPPALFVAH